MMDFFIRSVMAVCDPNSPFGCVEPPANPNAFNGDPVQQTGSFLTLVTRVVLTGGALTCLIYLMWGGFDWITSGGEKEKIMAAQRKITYAIIGIIFLMLSFGIFALVAGNILGLIKVVNGSLVFSLPKYGP